jgi:hypothetical protein
MLTDSRRRYELVIVLQADSQGNTLQDMPDMIVTELVPSLPETAGSLQYYRQLSTHCQILGYS